MKSWKSFERRVAKMIVERFENEGITEDDCYRTPMSGAHRLISKKSPGDLVISPKLRKLFNFSVECKAWNRVELHQLLIPFSKHKKSWQFNNWLAQAVREATNGRTPLLVFKADGCPILCAVPFSLGRLALPRITFVWRNEMWNVIPFDLFLKKLT